MSKFRFDRAGRIHFFCPGCRHNHCVSPRIHTVTGEGDHLTIRASILHNAPWKGKDRICHSFVTNGKITFLQDCHHDLAGQNDVTIEDLSVDSDSTWNELPED